MQICVSEFSQNHSFMIMGTSYAGKPKNNTAMYIAKKVQHLLQNLKNTKECLIFVEDGSEIPSEITNENVVVICKNPQLEFARFAERLMVLREEQEEKLSFKLTSDGYYISDNAVVGKNAKIGVGCVIGHNVKIGNNATIYSGCNIKNAVIGDNFFCNENAVIGSYSFTMANDENGNKYRIPSMGKVIIGNGVEIGANNNIACGSCGDTVIEDNVKLDALIHIGHDAHLCENVEITAGVTISGFVKIEKGAYFGVGSAVRNRISIGKNTIIGMGSVVTKSVVDNLTVAGNPAKPLEKKK